MTEKKKGPIGWLKYKISSWFKKGLMIVVFAGFAMFFLNFFITLADKFWGSLFKLAPDDDNYFFYGAGLLMTGLLIIIVGIITDIVRIVTAYLERVTPEPIKRLGRKLAAKIPKPEPIKLIWRFVFGSEKQTESENGGLKKGQAVIYSPYGLWGMKALGVITGKTEIAGKRYWRIITLSPPIAATGGMQGFVEDWQIVVILDMTWDQVIRYVASFGTDFPEKIGEIDKATFGIEEIKPEDLPSVERIVDIESIKSLLEQN